MKIKIKVKKFNKAKVNIQKNKTINNQIKGNREEELIQRKKLMNLYQINHKIYNFKIQLITKIR